MRMLRLRIATGLASAALAALAPSCLLAQLPVGSWPEEGFKTGLSGLANIRLRTDERVFAVMATLHAAGFEAETAGRGSEEIRERLKESIRKTDPELLTELKEFYVSHRPSENISLQRPQATYVSLALWLGPAPDFILNAAPDELPPDVRAIRGFEELVARFWKEARLADLWSKLQPRYARELDSYRPLFEEVVSSILHYFRVPMRLALEKEIVLIPDLLDVKGIVNARNLERTYFVVVGPSDDISDNRPQLEHEYLHFLLDNLVQKFGSILLEHESLLDLAQRQPHTRQDYQNQFLLVASESLIEAVQMRLTPPGNDREEHLIELFRRGLILAPYFYRSLDEYEQTPGATLPSYLETILQGIKDKNVRADAALMKEKEAEQRAAEAQSREALARAREEQERRNDFARRFDTASRLLSDKEFEEARELLLELHASAPENGNVLFYLGQASQQLGDYDSALAYYLDCSQSPRTEDRVIGWCKLRAGRILASKSEFEKARQFFEEVAAMPGDLDGAPEEAANLLGKLPPAPR